MLPLHLNTIINNLRSNRSRTVPLHLFRSNLNNVRIAIDLALNNFAIAKNNAGQTKVIDPHKNQDKDFSSSPDKEIILQMNEWIFVKHNYHFIKLSLNDLVYVEADNNAKLPPEQRPFSVLIISGPDRRQYNCPGG
ncbi:MAG: hypothetical protein LH478_07410 [Chitinophagaceae bacterium]|nr:hypothetical protein [Chitinophagaceae bacterium]